MVKIMIADDHTLIRRVLREVIEKEKDLEVVAEASNGREAEQQAAETQPDVVLMDLDMPECDGFEATQRVLACSPHSRVVIFTASHHEQHVFYAIQQGAVGYITKDAEPDAIIHAIRCAARDELCIPRALATKVLAQIRGKHITAMVPESDGGILPLSFSRSATPYKVPHRPMIQSATAQARSLTDRENEILDLMRKGRKNREIASELSIAESTVHKHIQNIFEKLHARNRTEAIYLTSTTA